MITRAGQVQDGERFRGLPGGEEQRRHAAFERGDALLDDIGGRIADPGVDVARNLEPEQRGRVCGVVEGVGRGLVDRQSAGMSDRIGTLTGMNLSRLEGPMRDRICFASVCSVFGGHE